MLTNPIRLFSDKSSIWKRINMTLVFEKMQLKIHKTAPDVKSSFQKYQSSVHRVQTCFG